MTFRKKLSKYCSAYTFLSQALDYGDPDLEVFYSFAKLLGHKIAGTSLDDVDVRGLVLRDFRISAQRLPEGVEGGELMPMGAGGSGAAPRRDTMATIERLNRTWGDEGDPLVKARAVNAVSDAVAADPVTNTQITNTSNTKEAVLADGRLRNIVIRALMSMMATSWAASPSRRSTTRRRSSPWPTRCTTSSRRGSATRSPSSPPTSRGESRWAWKATSRSCSVSGTASSSAARPRSIAVGDSSSST